MINVPALDRGYIRALVKKRGYAKQYYQSCDECDSSERFEIHSQISSPPLSLRIAVLITKNMTRVTRFITPCKKETKRTKGKKKKKKRLISREKVREAQSFWSKYPRHRIHLVESGFAIGRTDAWENNDLVGKRGGDDEGKSVKIKKRVSSLDGVRNFARAF